MSGFGKRFDLAAQPIEIDTIAPRPRLVCDEQNVVEIPPSSEELWLLDVQCTHRMADPGERQQHSVRLALARFLPRLDQEMIVFKNGYVHALDARPFALVLS